MSADIKNFLTELHLFKSGETCFAFLPRNLQLFEVDEDTYSKLAKLTSEAENNFGAIDCKDEDLISAGFIYEGEKPQEDPIKEGYYKAVEKQEDDGKIHITNTVLQIANDCNLNCIYCYGDGGSYGRERELMSFETAKKAIDFTVDNSEGVNNILIIFFGGEPLINFDVVKKTFDYCKSIESDKGKKFSFSMTTNGTILTDEIYRFIKDNRISVMISVDGGREIQDKHRCYCDGRGSFDDVKKNIEKFKEARGGYLTARATVCRTDFRFKNIKDDLLAMGFTNAITSMVDTSEDSDLFIGGEYTNEVLEQYRILADDYVSSVKKGEKNLNHLFTNYLNALYFKKMKIRGCNAGESGIAVGTNGKIYPCHRFMGMDDNVIGTIDDGIDIPRRNEYRKANVLTKEECKDCWARYLCSGACSHTSVSHTGSVFHAPTCYCDIYKGVIELVLYVYWELKKWDDDVFRKMMNDEEKTINDQAISSEYSRIE